MDGAPILITQDIARQKAAGVLGVLPERHRGIWFSSDAVPVFYQYLNPQFGESYLDNMLSKKKHDPLGSYRKELRERFLGTDIVSSVDWMSLFILFGDNSDRVTNSAFAATAFIANNTAGICDVLKPEEQIDLVRMLLELNILREKELIHLNGNTTVNSNLERIGQMERALELIDETVSISVNPAASGVRK